MTVVINGRFLRGASTGMERVGRGLIDAGRKAGLALEVLAPSGTEDTRVDRVAPVPPGRLGEHIWEQLVLPAAARGRPLLSLANTAPLMHSRSVVMIHDLGWRVGPEWFSRLGRIYGRLAWASARRAAGVLTPSDDVRSQLLAEGFRPERVFTVRNALDDGFGASAPEEVAEARTRLALTDRYFLFVGWADPRKDVATAIAAHRRVVRRYRHQLVLVGKPHPNFGRVMLPDLDSIRLLGYLPEPDLRAVLTGADALVFPSRYEGFGFPPLEALACGVPALVSDIPVLKESTSGAAHLVPLGDVAAWAEAMTEVLEGRIVARPLPPWRWSDAATALIEALRVLGFL